MTKLVVAASVLTVVVTITFISYASYYDSVVGQYVNQCLEICESNGYKLQGLEPPPNVRCICQVSIASVKIYEVRLP